MDRLVEKVAELQASKRLWPPNAVEWLVKLLPKDERFQAQRELVFVHRAVERWPELKTLQIGWICDILHLSIGRVVDNQVFHVANDFREGFHRTSFQSPRNGSESSVSERRNACLRV